MAQVVSDASDVSDAPVEVRRIAKPANHSRLGKRRSSLLVRFRASDTKATIYILPAFGVLGRPMWGLTSGDSWALQKIVVPAGKTLTLTDVADQILPDATNRSEILQALAAAKIVDRRFVLLPLGFTTMLQFSSRLRATSKSSVRGIRDLVSASELEMAHQRSTVVKFLITALSAVTAAAVPMLLRSRSRSAQRRRELATPVTSTDFGGFMPGAALEVAAGDDEQVKFGRTPIGTPGMRFQ